MKSILIAVAATLSLAAVGVANAQEDKAKAAGCMNCHAVDTKKVGPSFKDIAAKYKGNADAATKLVGEITSGKGHPAVKASAEDVKGIVTWVLSQ
jgi:cytochrome c